MHKGGPTITPDVIQGMAHARTGIGVTPPMGTDPIEARMLGAEAGKQVTPADISREQGFDALLAPVSAMAGYGMGNPISAAKGLVGGTVGSVAGGLGGAVLGKYLGGDTGRDIGAGLGGLAGSLYGGYRGASGKPAISPGMGKLMGMSRIGKAIQAFSEEEPSVRPGAAREMDGGTAATSADTALGSQAGPSQARAPNNPTELSSHVARTRAGVGSPSIYTPESLASEQGMSTAALGKGGFNLTIPPEQQKIMQMVAEGKVPMGSPATASDIPMGRPTPFPGPPRPATATTAGPAQPGFSGLAAEPGGPMESADEAARRGAPGISPVLKSVARKYKRLRQIGDQ